METYDFNKIIEQLKCLEKLLDLPHSPPENYNLPLSK